MALARAGVEAVPEQPAVRRDDVVERRDGHEEVPPVAPDLVLDVALLVARVGVCEGVVEPVVRREAPEELREPDLAPDAPADLGGVVSYQSAKHHSQAEPIQPVEVSDDLIGESGVKVTPSPRAGSRPQRRELGNGIQAMLVLAVSNSLSRLDTTSPTTGLPSFGSEGVIVNTARLNPRLAYKCHNSRGSDFC